MGDHLRNEWLKAEGYDRVSHDEETGCFNKLLWVAGFIIVVVFVYFFIN